MGLLWTMQIACAPWAHVNVLTPRSRASRRFLYCFVLFLYCFVLHLYCFKLFYTVLYCFYTVLCCIYTVLCCVLMLTHAAYPSIQSLLRRVDPAGDNRPAFKIIIFNARFIILNTKFIVFNANLCICQPFPWLQPVKTIILNRKFVI